MEAALKLNPVRVLLVSPKEAHHVWYPCLPMIEKALAHGQGDQTTAEAMLGSILLGQMALWVVQDDQNILAIVVVSTPKYSTTKKVFVELIAGSHLDVWAHAVEEALLRAKDEIQASCIEASCRKGLSRVLSKRGWSEKAVIMELK